jgi:hypothetical protein
MCVDIRSRILTAAPVESASHNHHKQTEQCYFFKALGQHNLHSKFFFTQF